MRVLVLTTSYPRHEADFAGRFLAETVERLRGRGLDVEVLAPGNGFADFGLGRGAGVVANARRRPWAVPPVLVSMARAARRAARGADVVHAHWLPNGLAAALSGQPFVLTLHGTDVALAERAPALARPVVRRARVVIGVSHALVRAAERLGARDARVVPNGVAIPDEVAEEADPPEVVYAGRLSPEKGIEDLLAVADGLHLVVAGDGPLRPQVPQALGMLPRDELSRLYGRAAVVVFPSRRDVGDGETGLLVPPDAPRAFRAAVDRLLADPDLRRRLGAAGRERIATLSSWDRVIDDTLAAYHTAVGSRTC